VAIALVQKTFGLLVAANWCLGQCEKDFVQKMSDENCPTHGL